MKSEEEIRDETQNGGILKVRSMFPPNINQWMRNDGQELGIIIMRSMMGLLWLSQAMIKLVSRNSNMYDDFDGFLGQLNWAMETHPWRFVSDILANYIIPNYLIVLSLVLITEFTIGISLSLGLFSRLGAFLGICMSISLWILTLGWGEWFWTYPLILFPHILFLLARSGKIVGIDRAILKTRDNRLLELLA